MYDRTISAADGERELSFEASGALKHATLVLRDRETDSWWSIMSARAIGGELAGTALVELPVAAKTTWGDWRSRHPDSLVLSVGSREHEPRDGYADYWTSERTFRDLEIEDRRLPAKEPVFAFVLDGQAFAVAHRSFENGGVFAAGPRDERRVLLYRRADASVRASSRAFLLPTRPVDPEGTDATDVDGTGVTVWEGEAAFEHLLATGAEPLAGFDTYWYSWVSLHPDTRLLTGRQTSRSGGDRR